MTEYDGLHEMLILIGSGDLGTFEAFCERMRLPLIRFVLSRFETLTLMDADDVVEEVFVKVKLEASRYRGANQDASAKKWIFTLAWNHALRTARIASKLPDSYDDWTAAKGDLINDSESSERALVRRIGTPMGTRPVEENVEMAILLESIFSKIQDFSPDEKNILTMRYVDGLKLHEIAAIIGRTKARVSQIIEALLQRIRYSLGVDLDQA